MGLKKIIIVIIIFLCSISSVYAALETKNDNTVKTVTYEHILNWSIGLIIVLSLFFACIWLMKKTGTLPINSKETMRVIAGLSLGMREKLVIVQVGNKQLILGISPGKIDNLLVLEGDDQLFQGTTDNQDEGKFSDKLKQIMMDSVHE